MRLTVTNLPRAIDQDLVDRNPLDQSAPFRAFDRMFHALPHCHAKYRHKFSSTQKKIKEILAYVRGKHNKLSCGPMGLVCLDGI